MKYRKSLFFIILNISLFCIDLSAKEKTVNWFTFDKPELSAQWGTSIPFSRDLRNPSPSEDLIFAADMRELRMDAGVKYQYNQFDFATHAYYMPTFHNAFQTGLGAAYHFYRYKGVFSENDITLTGRFRWIKGPVFSFENGVGYLFKFASIDAIREHKSYIFNRTYQFDIMCKWQLSQMTDIWCAIKLQDFFDYPLAISPFIKLGFDYAVAPGVLLGTDLTLKYIDMFFSAVYLNECILRFSFKVVL